MLAARIRELFDYYKELMAPWQFRMAISRLRLLRVPPDAWDDMMQELAILIGKFKYNPTRARGLSRETVLCRKMDQRIMRLKRDEVRYQGRVGRYGDLGHQTLDEQSPDELAGMGELTELVKELTPRQRMICREFLKGRSARQIAQATGLARETLRGDIKQMRIFLSSRGIRP